MTGSFPALDIQKGYFTSQSAGWIVWNEAYRAVRNLLVRMNVIHNRNRQARCCCCQVLETVNAASGHGMIRTPTVGSSRPGQYWLDQPAFNRNRLKAEK